MPAVVDIIIYATVLVVGAAVGSFLNVLAYRIPRKLGFVRGRSACPHCGHTLKALDLVPVVSYLALGRRCRYCREPVPVRYIAIELATALLALACWLAFNSQMPGAPDPASLPGQAAYPLLVGNSALFGNVLAPVLGAVLYFAVLCVLLTVAIIDADTMEIPDGLAVALFACAALAVFAGPAVGFVSRVIGMLCISVPLLLIALAKPGAFGGGDIKLMAAAGFLLGWQATLVAAFIGIVIGGGFGVYLLASGKKGAREHFAFGPFLCIGIAAAMFAAEHIIRWYLQMF